MYIHYQASCICILSIVHDKTGAVLCALVLLCALDIIIYICIPQITCYMEEWRRLKLKVLRHRIQRLVVLMDLCEPGTVPNPGMLASLIDLVRL